MIQRTLKALAANAPTVFAVLGLAFLVAAVWTIDRADLGTTLGLAATGVGFLILEWRLS